MPPEAPGCLSTPYSAKPGQRGGTLIDEEVTDLATHRRLVVDPDGYRPDSCPTCFFKGLVHAHDFRPRRLRAQPESPEEQIRRFRCPPCGAVWQVLPAVIARHLHRTWDVVQSAMVRSEGLDRIGNERRVRVGARTVRRWAGRLLLSALVLVQVLGESASFFEEVLADLGLACTRAQLVESLADGGLVEPERKLADVASWVHRLVPGVRLM